MTLTDLSEPRLYAVFSNGGDSPRRAFGPYRVVEVKARAVFAFGNDDPGDAAGFLPVRLADRGRDEFWRLRDVPEGEPFADLLVLSAKEGITAKEIEAVARRKKG
jgi:hypothetical protein